MPPLKDVSQVKARFCAAINCEQFHWAKVHSRTLSHGNAWPEWKRVCVRIRRSFHDVKLCGRAWPGSAATGAKTAAGAEPCVQLRLG